MSSIPASSYYYSDEINNNPNVFYNSLLSTSLAIEYHFKDILFKGDINRILWASNEYCFKERSRFHEGLLNIPFMNYYLKEISPDTSPRALWNHEAQVRGLRDFDSYLSRFGKPIRLVPVRLSFESNVFFNQPFDAMYAFQQLKDDSANEIILYSSYQSIDNNILVSPNFMTYTPEWNPEYTEKEWLEQNKIISVGMDFEIITFFIYTDGVPISVSNELILEFFESKNFITDMSDTSVIDPSRIIKEYLTFTP